MAKPIFPVDLRARKRALPDTPNAATHLTDIVKFGEQIEPLHMQYLELEEFSDAIADAFGSQAITGVMKACDWNTVRLSWAVDHETRLGVRIHLDACTDFRPKLVPEFGHQGNPVFMRISVFDPKLAGQPCPQVHPGQEPVDIAHQAMLRFGTFSSSLVAIPLRLINKLPMKHYWKFLGTEQMDSEIKFYFGGAELYCAVTLCMLPLALDVMAVMAANGGTTH